MAFEGSFVHATAAAPHVARAVRHVGVRGAEVGVLAATRAARLPPVDSVCTVFLARRYLGQIASPIRVRLMVSYRTPYGANFIDEEPYRWSRPERVPNLNGISTDSKTVGWRWRARGCGARTGRRRARAPKAAKVRTACIIGFISLSSWSAQRALSLSLLMMMMMMRAFSKWDEWKLARGGARAGGVGARARCSRSRRSSIRRRRRAA